MRKMITNARIITEEKINDNFSLILEDDKICEITDKVPENFNGEIINAEKKYVSAGFIDIHTHGGGGYDYMDGSEEAFIKAYKTHLKHGTTTLLATTLTSSNEELYKAFEIFKQIKKKPEIQIAGLHLEGPYFNPSQCGAQDTRYIRNPEYKDYSEIVKHSGDIIIRWSAAPELNGFTRFARFLKEKGIIGSIAHTDGFYEDALKAYNEGIKLYTHFYSSMSSIRRVNGYRKLGIVEGAYLLDDTYVEIIADGHHLPAELIKMIYKFKGKDKIVLITDSMRGAGTGAKESVLGSLTDGQRVDISDGVARIPGKEGFAGSIATADILIKTVCKKADIPLPVAIKMITENPAKAIGIKNKGVLAKNYDADIVMFDENIEIKDVYVKGCRISSF